MTSKIAFIREAECIGCIKCIKACSDNAILGARKQMHTIITDLCTGCEDCIAVCPVDCIEMINKNPLSNSLLPQPGEGARRADEGKLILPPQSPADKKDLIAAAIKRTLERRGWKNS